MSDTSGRDGEDAREQPMEERLAELETQIEELRRQIGPPRGPLGLPRPPSPGELLRFADEHAIPTTIAILEANVRALEALRDAIGLLRRVEDRDRRERSEGLRDRTDTLAREAIEEFDRAVMDLAEAVEGGGLPDEEEARSVLREARTVREEAASGTEIDVEAELDSIREEVRGEGTDSGENGDQDDEAGA
jgi:hypothetical protein